MFFSQVALSWATLSQSTVISDENLVLYILLDLSIPAFYLETPTSSVARNKEYQNVSIRGKCTISFWTDLVEMVRRESRTAPSPPDHAHACI